jgi:hypothetical protein
MLYDTKRSDEFGGNKLYLHAFNTNIGREVETVDGFPKDSVTVDGVNPYPFLWAEAVAFKYDTAGSPGQKYYANFNFAPPPSPTDDIGEAGNPLGIRTMAHMRNLEDSYTENFARQVDGGIVYVTLTRDVDAEDAGFYDTTGPRYLSSLKSHIVLDGIIDPSDPTSGNYTITGMKGMLVDRVEGTVKNLNVSGANITPDNGYYGVFVNTVYGSGVVENCTVTDTTITVLASLNWLKPGAFVKENNGTIKDCTVSDITLNAPDPSLAVTFYANAGPSTGEFINCYVESDEVIYRWP